ncbi:MAG: hypothetical protein KAY08_02520 [Giesbergeria sp.]|nr:hypothetical protein [Giesbergeria sp.]MBP8091688.1 hypothetical protein [Giesbergeria sp.]
MAAVLPLQNPQGSGQRIFALTDLQPFNRQHRFLLLKEELLAQAVPALEALLPDWRHASDRPWLAANAARNLPAMGVRARVSLREIVI